MDKRKLARLITALVVGGNLLLILYIIAPGQKSISPAAADAVPAANAQVQAEEAASADMSVDSNVPASAPVTQNADDADIPEPAPAPRDPSTTPATEIEDLRTSVRDFRQLLGENPIGTNAEITAMLLGDNLKQARVLPPESAGQNEKGELLDRWGTPFFFHQLSGREMEIRSAGPDAKMWSEDDIVVK